MEFIMILLSHLSTEKIVSFHVARFKNLKMSISLFAENKLLIDVMWTK